MPGISLETARVHLLRIGYVLKALHSIPHILTDDLKHIRVEMCHMMLAALRVQEHNQCHNMITGDESWFYCEYVRDRMWISFLDNTPDYANRTIATETHMLTLFWSPSGFQAVAVLLEGTSFNATWFIDGNLAP
jgi:hypothetical protein